MIERLAERLQTKIRVEETTGCWLWTAATTQLGYGYVNLGRHGRSGFAHRYIYKLLVGDPGPLDLDHLCRVRHCVNPDHLEPVDHAENLRRGVGAAVAAQRYANHLWCPRGHPLFGPNLYAYRMKSGYVNKLCRTCRAANDRARKERRRAERLKDAGECW